ncbi:MAG TPA: ribonuclease H family protein [Catalimonadaceae bacterium]|nr:ribonuclease H family protein [Catalimonadaceae bacterium]
MAPTKKPKFYVVLKGHKPGIYLTWAETQAQTHQFSGPVFKSFETKSEAELAWKNQRFEIKSANKPDKRDSPAKGPKPSGAFLVVDAACSGSPGPTEYQGFFFPNKVPIFHIKIGLANNNIGEFLAIVHAMAWMDKNGYNLPVYSDSKTAISWVRLKKVKSELPRNSKTEKAWELVDRALSWLSTHSLPGQVKKWETEVWGENPADFGRK